MHKLDPRCNTSTDYIVCIKRATPPEKSYIFS